jgi:hypothetical protein
MGVLGPRPIKGFSSSQIILEEETPLLPPLIGLTTQTFRVAADASDSVG